MCCKLRLDFDVVLYHAERVKGEYVDLKCSVRCVKVEASIRSAFVQVQTTFGLGRSSKSPVHQDWLSQKVSSRLHDYMISLLQLGHFLLDSVHKCLDHRRGLHSQQICHGLSCQIKAREFRSVVIHCRVETFCNRHILF